MQTKTKRPVKMMNTRIALADTHKTIIIDSIAEAIGQDINDYKQDNALFTYNGIHFTKWDFINTNIVRSLPSNIKAFKIERGNLWAFLLLHDKESGNVYVFMAEKRFNQLTNPKTLERRQIKMKPHFLDAFVQLNKGLIAPAGQPALFEVEQPEWNELCQTALHKMTNFLVGEVNNLVVVVHSASRGEIKSVEAYILTSELEVFHSEDWSQLITPNFASVLEIVEDVDLSEEDIPLTIKSYQQQEDDIIQLRKDDKEEEE